MYKPQIVIKDTEFTKFKNWLYENVGIALKESKSRLVEGRLAPRLRHYNLTNYDDYFQIISRKNDQHEAQIAVDLLTTNETYFFRESTHFDFLLEKLLSEVPSGNHFRLWCAASSSGEEPYTLAMTLAEGLGATSWKILATDINMEVLEKANSGHYALERAHNISKNRLQKYCLKGSGKQDGTFIIKKELRDKVTFQQLNLIKPFPKMEKFDVVFLRNVMIYFDDGTRIKVIQKVIESLKVGGYLFVSHSESLTGLSDKLKMIQPSIFIKV
jgi:chemotaxis protein methyltransferase CheR